MAETPNVGLFGPTSQQVARQVREKGRATDVTLAQMPQGTAGNLLARGVGRSIGNIMRDDSKNPEVIRAQKMEIVKKQMAATGLEPSKDPVRFLEMTSKFMLDQGLTEDAFRVGQGAANFKMKQAELKVKQDKARANIADSTTKRSKELRELRTEPLNRRHTEAKIDKLLAEARFKNQTGFTSEGLKGLPNTVKKFVIAEAAENFPEFAKRLGGAEAVAAIRRDALNDTQEKATISDWVLEFISDVEAGNEITPERQAAFDQLKSVPFVQKIIRDFELGGVGSTAPTGRGALDMSNQ